MTKAKDIPRIMQHGTDEEWSKVLDELEKEVLPKKESMMTTDDLMPIVAFLLCYVAFPVIFVLIVSIVARIF